MDTNCHRCTHEFVMYDRIWWGSDGFNYCKDCIPIVDKEHKAQFADASKLLPSLEKKKK